MSEVWGLISDVHGNYPALELALRVLAAESAGKLAFLGDYLGRGDSDGCVDLIKANSDIAVVGNRDLDWQDRVAPATKAWVLGLPRTAQANGLLISHGDRRLTPSLSTQQISQRFQRVWPELERHQACVWAFGHSHQARTWRKSAEELELAATPTVPIERGEKYCVNVGTTGLPFPGKGGPSVAIVDFQRGEIRHLALDQGLKSPD